MTLQLASLWPTSFLKDNSKSNSPQAPNRTTKSETFSPNLHKETQNDCVLIEIICVTLFFALECKISLQVLQKLS